MPHTPGGPASGLAGLHVEPVAAKWWGGDRHLVHYFVSAGRDLNFVAPVPSSGWDEESWTSPGRVTDLLADFGAFPPQVREVIARTGTLMRSALYDRDPLPRWTYGRVSMLGDACHPMAARPQRRRRRPTAATTTTQGTSR